MCLIAFAWRAHPRYPLIVAANRDEFHSRPTRALELWGEDPDVMGGRDLEAGGSWMGVTRTGRFAAVTNYRTAHPGPGEKSRGALVGDFLLGREPAPCSAAKITCEAKRYGPYNLLLGDGRELVWATNRPAPVWHTVAEGVHGVSNGAPSFSPEAPWPKVVRLVGVLEKWIATHPGTADRAATAPLFTALANEADTPEGQLPSTGLGHEMERRLARVFVRGAEYGTRCSSVLLVGTDGRCVMYEHRFGPEGVPSGETELGWPATA